MALFLRVYQRSIGGLGSKNQIESGSFQEAGAYRDAKIEKQI